MRGKDIQHEAVLHSQGSARNLHTWNIRGKKTFLETDAAGKKLGTIYDMWVLFAPNQFMALVQS